MKGFICSFAIVCVFLSGRHCAAQTLDFEYLGDKPDKTSRIPNGYNEYKFTPPVVCASLLYKADDVKVFGHHYQEAVMPGTRFALVPQNKSWLQITATLGEYEPVSFTLHADKNLSNLSLKMTDLKLQGSDSVIFSNNAEIRRVDFRPRNTDIPYRLGLSSSLADKKKYVMAPVLLVKEDKCKIPRGENRTFWLTVHVPLTAKPGIYTGNIMVEWADGKFELPVKLQVLPFRLGPPPIMFGMYYNYGDWYKNWQELQGNELKDLASRGFGSVVSGIMESAAIRGNELYVTGDLWWGEFVKKLKDAGINGCLVRSGFFSEPNLFIKDGYDFGRDPEHFRKVVKSIYGKVADPEGKLEIPLLVAPWDEPDFKGREVMRDAIRDFKLIRNAGGKSYVSAGGPCIGLNSASLFAPDIDVVCYNGGGRYPEYSSAAHRRGKDYWYYANGAIPGWCRIGWGLGGWALDTDGITSWTYRSMPPDDSYHELTADTYGFVRLYTYPSKKGPIPTTAWECVREGMDDYRYLAALENLVALSKTPQGDDARRFLDTLRKNVLDLQSVYGSMVDFHEKQNPQYYEKIRALVAGHIIRISLMEKGRSDLAGKIKIPVLHEIKCKMGQECIRDCNGISLCQNSEKSGWHVEKSGGIEAIVSACPDEKNTRCIKIKVTDDKPSRVRLIYDITQDNKQLAGKKLRIAADIFGKSDIHGVKVNLLQFDNAGKALTGRVGEEYGNAVSYRTFILEPGKWATRQVTANVHPDAKRLELVLEMPVLNVNPDEKGNEIYIRNISVKPIIESSMDVPEFDLAKLSNLVNEELIMPSGTSLPYPRQNRFSDKTGKPITQTCVDGILLSDNVPAMAGQRVRTGIAGIGEAALLIDGKHDIAHSMTILPDKTGVFEFDLKQIVSLSKIEVRGFEWDKWGYGILPIEIAVKNSDGKWEPINGQWQKRTLVGYEPWEACYVMKPVSSVKTSKVRLTVSGSLKTIYISEIYLYGTAAGTLLPQLPQPTESNNYPVEPSVNNPKERLCIKRAVLVNQNSDKLNPEIIIDGNYDNRLVLNGPQTAIEFQLAKPGRISGVDMYLGSVNWSNKAIPRYLRLLYFTDGKWLPWGKPLVGNMALQRSMKLPPVITDRIRLELIGSWTRDVNVLREVEFFGTSPYSSHHESTDNRRIINPYVQRLKKISAADFSIYAKLAWVAYRAGKDGGIYLQSVNKGIACISAKQPFTKDFSVEAEVSDIVSQNGGYGLFVVEDTWEKTLTEGSRRLSDEVAAIYFAQNNAKAQNEFVLYYYAADGQIMSYTKDGGWSTGWHLSGVRWDNPAKYRISIYRTNGMLRMLIKEGQRIILSPTPIPVAGVRDQNEKLTFVLGDILQKASQGCMLVNELKLDDKNIALKQVASKIAKQGMITDDLPEYGLFKFGRNSGYIQMPANYMPDKKYPFILFFHGRGGTSADNNLLSEEFSVFLRKVSQKGYIIAAPGYGSDSWMNPSAEKIAKEMVDFLRKRISIDPNRFYVMGTSMGGAAALTFTALNPKMVTATCDIFGISDFTRFYNEGFFNNSIREAFGGTPKQCPEMYRQRSGIDNIDTIKSVPLLIIHGDKDNVVPMWNSKTLFELLTHAGGKAKLIVVKGVGHENKIIYDHENMILEFFYDAVLE